MCVLPLYFQIINFQLYFFAKYHLNTLLFVYNFLGTRESKKQVFSQTGPKKILIGSAHERAWHQGVASRISVARIVADDDQNVTVETSDSRALCSVNGHQIKVDNEPQQLCDGDRLGLGDCTHVKQVVRFVIDATRRSAQREAFEVTLMHALRLVSDANKVQPS